MGMGNFRPHVASRPDFDELYVIYRSYLVFPCKDVPFGGSLIVATPHLGVKIPPPKNAILEA